MKDEKFLVITDSADGNDMLICIDDISSVESRDEGKCVINIRGQLPVRPKQSYASIFDRLRINGLVL